MSPAAQFWIRAGMFLFGYWLCCPVFYRYYYDAERKSIALCVFFVGISLIVISTFGLLP